MLSRFLMSCTLLLVLNQSVTASTWELLPQVKTIRVNGHEMAYLERGTGVPIVLVHGVLSDYRYWAAQMEPFAERYRTVAVSLRHAYPERWNGAGEDFSIRQHAHDLAAFITGLHVGPVHVVGHSRGGDVVLLMARKHPELLRSVILADPAPLESLLPTTPKATVETEKRRGFINTAVERLRHGDIDGGLAGFVEGVSVPGAWRMMSTSQQQAMRDNAWSIKSLLTDAKEPFSCTDAGQVTAPVLLVTGENSPRSYGLMMEALASCLKRQEKATIPKAAHGMIQANPPAFNAAVLEFVARPETP